MGYSTGDGIIGILDLASGGTTTYPAAGPVAALRFSAGADRVAYRTVDGGLRHLELGSGEETQLADLVSGYDWSPSGLEIAFTRGDGSQNSLAVVTPATGLVTVLSSSTSTRFTAPRFAPDGTRLAFLASVLGATAELRLFDLSLGRESVVDTSVGGEAPSWSPDGQLLAYGTGGKPGKVRVRSVETGALVRELSSDQGDAQRPAIAPDGERLAFEDNGPLGPRVLVAGLAGGAPVSTRVAEPRLVQWTTGRVAVVEGDRLFFLAPTDGAFRFEGVALSPGQNTVVARARDAESGLESPDSETVLVTVPAESFPDLAVLAVEQAAFPASPVLGQPAQLLLRVRSATCERS